MLARRAGHIVAMSSLASYHGLPRMAGYCASKAGVSALMDALRVELTPLGLNFTTVCPGWIRTPLTADLDLPMPDILEVSDAAARIVKGIAEKRPFFAFPAKSVRRVRLLSWLPVRMGDWLIYRLLRALAKK